MQASAEYRGCTLVTLKQVAELIFERYKTTSEHQMTMIGFLINCLRTQKYLTYHSTVSGRMYSAGEKDAKWLSIPERCRTNHTREFSSAGLYFIQAKIPEMLMDLKIGTKKAFTDALTAYRGRQ